MKNISNKSMGKRRFFYAALLLLSFGISMNAKESKGVIMTVDGEDIPTEEFLYLFQKNNNQQVQPQTLDEYLQLFEIYRLKVAEAKSEGVDTMASFKKEMDMYKRDLLEPYIQDTVFFNQLVDIAVQRDKEAVESSHIMIIRTNDAAKDKRKLQVLDSVRNALLNGGDFIEMAKNYSEDKFSSEKGGYLGFTPAGTFPYAFETAVYETPEGEISDIVESHVGWHIVKAGARKPASELNLPQKSYDDIKSDVRRKSSSPFDARFHQIRRNTQKNLSAKHKNVKVADLSDDDAYAVLIEAEENEQYNSNPEYKNLVDEYVNGSLLYEVSVENVWNKAANDNEGLEAYFQSHKDNYKWDAPHAKGVLLQVVNDSVADKLRQQIADMPMDSIMPFVRKNYKREAQVDRYNVSKGVNPIIDNLVFGEKVEIPKNKNFNSYFVVYNRFVESPENANDVKSLVVNDYQEVLEKEWIEKLKKKHKVEINKKELATIRKNLKK